MNSPKIALVSHDLSRLPDYAPHLSTIANACESWGVDTIHTPFGAAIEAAEKRLRVNRFSAELDLSKL
jgi:hypothetical protein